jgi:HAD domain in Swiss Army Knife RNA repair proteins
VTSTKPLLLLDIDGVLCPFGGDLTDGYELFDEETALYVSRTNTLRLARLAEYFELAWASRWGHDANVLLCDFDELPPLPHIDFSALLSMTGTFKLPAIELYVEDRPFAWVDDQIGEDAFEWAAEREEPTLFIQTDAAVGLTDEIVDELIEFARAQANG